MVKTNWPPAWAALPDNLDAIEAGQQRQGELFPEVPDDTRAARLARIVDAIPGLTLADRLPMGRRGVKIYHFDTEMEAAPRCTFFGDIRLTQ